MRETTTCRGASCFGRATSALRPHQAAQVRAAARVFGARRDSSRSTGASPRFLLALLVLCLLIVGLTACGGGAGDGNGGVGGAGGASKEAGTTATDTARAYIAAWEANDSSAMEALLTPNARELSSLTGGVPKYLQDKSQAMGAPIPGKGRVLKVQESGDTSQADVAVVYDCTKVARVDCPKSELPDWAPPGSSSSADRLTLEKQQDGKWLITYVQAIDAVHNGRGNMMFPVNTGY